VTLRGRLAKVARIRAALTGRREIFADLALLSSAPLVAQMALKRHHDFDAELGRSDRKSVSYEAHEREAQARCATRIGAQARALIDHGNPDGVVFSPCTELDRPGPLAGVCVSDGICHGLGYSQRDLVPVSAVTGGEFRDRLSRRGYRCGRGPKLDLVQHLLCDHFSASFPVACQPLRPPLGLIRRLPQLGVLTASEARSPFRCTEDRVRDDRPYRLGAACRFPRTPCIAHRGEGGGEPSVQAIRTHVRLASRHRAHRFSISGMADTDFVRAHRARFKALIKSRPREEAMRLYVGGTGDPVSIGRREKVAIARFADLDGAYVIDIGCGVGRLTAHLPDEPIARYLGTDVVPEVLAEADPDDARFHFELVDDIVIPEADGAADIVCAFSVITHLMDDETFRYFRER
jgi:hypothetical protein